MNKHAIQWTLFSIIATLIIGPLASADAQTGAVGVPARQGYLTNQILSFLSYAKVQKEIEMVPEQLEKINKMRTKLNQSRSTIYKEAAKLPAEERQKAIQEAYAQSYATAEKEMEEILLPHQINRLKEVVLQFSMRSSFAYTLTQSEVAEAIELNEKQMAELRKKEVELNREMTKKAQEFYSKMRAENREQLMQMLTDKQRRKLQSLLGEKYDWNTTTNR